jgi:hypothetical protein
MEMNIAEADSGEGKPSGTLITKDRRREAKKHVKCRTANRCNLPSAPQKAANLIELVI